MREDMFKVIVERPRRIHSNAYCKDGWRFRNSEEAPARLGMRRGYGDSKWLNENLAPLKRYLESQVNRPWDKVYSEIRATIDGRSTVKQHILQHLEDFVALRTRWIDDGAQGAVLVSEGKWWGGHIGIEQFRYELYVHPRTGILLRNRHSSAYRQGSRKDRSSLEQQQAVRRRILDSHTQLHCVDGIWYCVTLSLLPAPVSVMKQTGDGVTKRMVYGQCWDVLKKQWLSREHGSGLHYGDKNLYATSKRQLSSIELKRYGLVSN